MLITGLQVIRMRIFNSGASLLVKLMILSEKSILLQILAILSQDAGINNNKNVQGHLC